MWISKQLAINAVNCLWKKGTSAMLELLKQAKTVGIPAKYVLFDSCFFHQAPFML